MDKRGASFIGIGVIKMNQMNIENAQYALNEEGNNNIIQATINNVEWSVPLDPANRYYAEIMRQVEAGELTIEPADSE